jgi:hypothetical protein
MRSVFRLADDFYLGESEKLRRLVATGRIKSMEIFAGLLTRRRFVPFANKSELRQKLSVNFFAVSMFFTRKSM